jgi:hypothetical protein
METPPALSPLGAFSWTHGGWTGNRLALTPRLPGFETQIWLETRHGGLALCKPDTGEGACARFSRCPP